MTSVCVPRSIHRVADLGEQVDVEFIGEKQGFRGQQPFHNGANASEFGDPLRVVVTRHMPRPLPHITDLVQPPPDGFARDFNFAPRLQLRAPAWCNSIWCDTTRTTQALA
jgi:hypothetical protein